MSNMNKWLCRFIIIGGAINSFSQSVFGQSDELDYNIDYYDPSDQIAMEIEVQPYNGNQTSFHFS